MVGTLACIMKHQMPRQYTHSIYSTQIFFMAPDRMTHQFIQRLLAIALSMMLAACSSSGHLKRPQESLMAVVDAGSSGSRIYLYKTTPDDSFIKINELFTDKNVPHELSWYDGNRGADSAPGNAGASGIQPLLSAMAAYMHSNGITKDQVRVSVLATAGMRMVDARTVGAIYQSVKTTIANNGFLIRQVDTLSGQNEGLYAWADVNYMMKNFEINAPTKGIIEIGGASSQIAFVTSDKKGSNVTNIKINGVYYPVFSVSYLGLGLNQARRAMINDQASGDVHASVCYPNNTTGSPATYDANVDSIRISSTGSQFSALACHDVFSKMITQLSASASNGYPVTKISSLGSFDTTQFLGLSAAYNLLRDWGSLRTANPQKTLENAVATTCSGANAWPRVLAQYKNISNVFSQNGCANASYLNAYIYGPQSLGIHPAQLSGTGSINGSKLTWTRGYVLVEAAP